MAYHGYIPFISEYSKALFQKNKEKVKILEVGIEYGITTYSILNNNNLIGVPFIYHGVDLLLRDHVRLIGHYTFKIKETEIKFFEENSLSYLKNCKEKYDIILVDGDHNYPTVSEECKFIKSLMKSNDSLIIFDDYTGRWSNRDLYYSDREEYTENNKFIDLDRSNDKKGVAPAVDEFLESNKDMSSFVLMQGEPICIIHNDNTILERKNED